MVLYQWRWSLPKDSRDLRGWLGVRKSGDTLSETARGWASATPAQRQSFVDTVAQACPLAVGDSVAACRSEYGDLVRRNDGGNRALRWLQVVTRRGQAIYDSKFGVQRTHEGVDTRVTGGQYEIAMPTYGIDADVFSWIQGRVDEAWVFPGTVGVKLYQAPTQVRGAVKVRWEKGALPNVNGIAGDVITMDSNTPRWLELTQTVMRQEMGHVLGFPDCYTEFWDTELEAFTYYTLDPEDAMCALSGQYLDRHKEALVRGYF
jgi:hypothetical protein